MAAVNPTQFFKDEVQEMANEVICPAGWKHLYQTALSETDPGKITERIVDARNAVLDRIEDLLSCSSCAERQALSDAFRVLGRLQDEFRQHPKLTNMAPLRKTQFVRSGLGMKDDAVAQVP
jgi:hypothetical protein